MAEEKKRSAARQPSDSMTAAGLSVLRVVLTQLGTIFGTVKKTFKDAPEPPQVMQWKAHVPQLARTIADMIDLEPSLFSWVRFGSSTLRQLEQEVLLLQEIKAFLDGLWAYVDGLLKERKHDLTGKTSEVVDGLRQAIGSPLTPEELKVRLQEISHAVLSVVEERNAAVRTKRAENLSRVEAGREEVGRLVFENQVLRGELPQTPVAARSRRKRVTRR